MEAIPDSDNVLLQNFDNGFYNLKYSVLFHDTTLSFMPFDDLRVSFS